MGDAYIVRRGGGVDTEGLTADTTNVLKNKTFLGIGSDEPQIGSIPLRSAATITPSATNQTIAAGQYLNGAQIIKGDSNLLPKNIKSGVSLFGVLGVYGGIAKGASQLLTEGKERLAATTVGGYAIFAGGYNGITTTDTVDAYDVNLTSTTLPPLSVARSNLAATTVMCWHPLSVREYAIFAGGHNGTTATDTVDAYDAHLTHTTFDSLSVARSDLAATTVGEYAIFAGGHNGTTATDTVDAYDSDLTRTTPTSLDWDRHSLAATTVGEYAIFAGGHNGTTATDTVEIYDVNLTRATPSSLDWNRHSLAATTVGEYAIFAGGHNGTTATDTVDAYDVNLTHTRPTDLDWGRDHLAATTVGGYALFAGGCDSGGSTNEVDAYDATLVMTVQKELSEDIHNMAATTVNGHALFAGGIHQYSGDEYSYISNSVHTYKMSF